MFCRQIVYNLLTICIQIHASLIGELPSRLEALGGVLERPLEVLEMGFVQLLETLAAAALCELLQRLRCLHLPLM